MGESSSASNNYGKELVSGAVYELYGPPTSQPSVEIVFMHGLQLGDFKKAYWKTWRARDGTKTYWPKTWLGRDYPNARILSLCYDTGVWKTKKNEDPETLVKNILQYMITAMIGQKDCPVIFVCHSLGGLLAKEIVLTASDLESVEVRRLVSNIKGFFFFATPHSGSMLAGSWLVGSAKLFFSMSPMVDYLKVLNMSSKDLHDKFLLKFAEKFNSNDWKLYVVAEGLKTRRYVFKSWVVEVASARIGKNENFLEDRNSDHNTVCKPKTDADEGYKHLKKCINEVLEDHKHKEENRIVSLSVKHFGIDDVKLEEIRERLKKVSIVGLVGMGGAGKTTLSKVFYNAELKQYKKSSYLEKVALKDIKVVQKQLFKDLFPYEKEVKEVKNEHLAKIRQCLGTEKVLVIVDDVEPQKDTLKDLQLLGVMKESKVIVTCRDQGVLTEASLHTCIDVMMVEGIKDDRGSDMALFRHYAFDGVAQDVEDKFQKVAKDIVNHCDGLPLSLEVIGKYLNEVNRDEKNISYCMDRWDEALQRLQDAESITGDANDRLWARLQISYDQLAETEREIFLAFACIFSKLGPARRTIGWICHSPNSIAHLIKRSLIRVDDAGKNLSMHNQLQDMGRKISGPDSSEPRYLWEKSKILRFLTTNESSTTLKGLLLYEDEDHIFQSTNKSSDKSKDEADDKIMVDKSCEAEEALQQNSSKGYSQLALLGVSDMNSRHVVDYCLFKASEEELRWLCLERSKITEKGLHRIWSLKGLRVLQILECLQLEEIPSSVGDLTHLVELEIEACSNLKSLPDAIAHLKDLKRLRIDEAKLSVIPVGVGQLPKLEYLSITNCDLLTSMCDFESSMDSLQELHIERNYNLKTIKGLSSLCSLRILSLSWCSSLGTCDLPGSLEKLSLLETLDLFYCKGLCQEVADTLRNGQLHTRHLKVLKLPIIPEKLPRCPQLKVLRLDNGLNLNEFPSNLFNNMPGLKVLQLNDKNGGLKDLPDSLGNLAKLRHLELSDFTELVELPEAINQLSQIQSLELFDCLNLARLPVSLGDLPWLSQLWVINCEKVEWEEPSQRSLRDKLESRGCDLDIDDS